MAIIDFSKISPVSMLFHEMENFKSAEYKPSVVQPLLGSIAYAAIVIGLKKYVAQRDEKVDTKNLAIVHNIILIVLSLVTAIGASHALWQRAVTDGFMGLFCAGIIHPAGTILDGPAGFWIKVFHLTKYYEFVDTFLICLKGNKTIPLHLYHHVIMVWATWSWCTFEVWEGMLWAVIANSLIHTAMYSYYLLAVFGKKVWWKKYLTSAQIVQFLTAVHAIPYFYMALTRDDGCGLKERLYASWFSHLVNISFVVLFVQFYMSTYSSQIKEAGVTKKTD